MSAIIKEEEDHVIDRGKIDAAFVPALTRLINARHTGPISLFGHTVPSL
jgi:hypothetical protein